MPVQPRQHDWMSSADAREERLAQNEVLFRSVNEAIEQKAIELGGADRFQFICECSSANCVERVTMSLGEYEHVRSNGARFFVKPGHENDEVELVVASLPLYSIVEKDGAAGVLAELEDPRDGQL